MHACLHISEIVQNIAYNADGGLVSLALTCRAFYEPAMNAVWRDLPGLRPLLLCFPRAVVNVAARHISFRRHPVPAERRRFEHHASRVRHLTISFGGTDLTWAVSESCLSSSRMTAVTLGEDFLSSVPHRWRNW